MTSSATKRARAPTKGSWWDTATCLESRDGAYVSRLRRVVTSIGKCTIHQQHGARRAYPYTTCRPGVARQQRHSALARHASNNKRRRGRRNATTTTRRCGCSRARTTARANQLRRAHNRVTGDTSVTDDDIHVTGTNIWANQYERRLTTTTATFSTHAQPALCPSLGARGCHWVTTSIVPSLTKTRNTSVATTTACTTQTCNTTTPNTAQICEARGQAQ